MMKKSIKKVMLWTAAVTVILTLVGSHSYGEQITVNPVEISDVLHNPDMGWCFYSFGCRSVEDNTTNFLPDDAPLLDIVILDFMWTHLEPENNVFNWDVMDGIIDYWTSRGKQYSMRICMSYYDWSYSGGWWYPCDPETTWDKCDPPDWLFDELGCGYDTITIAGKNLKRPHYNDPIFLEQHQELLNAVAARYDAPDNKSCFMEIRSYGAWGEWHDCGPFTGSPGSYVWPNSTVKHDTLAALITQHTDAFQYTPFCIAGWKEEGETYADFDDYMYKFAYDVSESLGVMNRRDGFPGVDTNPTAYWDRRLWDHWPEIPTIGETTGSGISWSCYNRMLDYHVNVANTWISKQSTYDTQMTDLQDMFEAGLKAGGLGYRFVLSSATYDDRVLAGGVFALKQTWVNRNVGRAYRVYPLKVYFIDPDTGKEIWSAVDGKFDQTSWIKGQSYNVTSRFSLPAEVPSGTYDLRVAMVDGTGKPVISLAIAGGDTQKRYRIGSVIVSN
jgi:hypothetical protein